MASHQRPAKTKRSCHDADNLPHVVMEGRSSTLYLVNPHLEVGDVQGEWCLLRLPGWAQNIEATPYQLSLLQRFEQPKTLSSVLETYPFHREASSEFLMACVSAQFLLPADAAGRPKLPSVRRVSSTMFAAPATRADEPSAFTFMGVPFDANTTGAAGARFGPSAIRAASEG
ncbi:MAG: arginase family protein, partial [Myxococcota bacterium]